LAVDLIGEQMLHAINNIDTNSTRQIVRDCVNAIVIKK